MYHEQLVKHNNLNTKMNLHNDDDNVNDGDIHVIIIMLAYKCRAFGDLVTESLHLSLHLLSVTCICICTVVHVGHTRSL